METLDGVVYVHNPDEPIFPNRTVRFEEELTFGEDQGEDKLVLNVPSGLQVDGSDNIYVSDSRDAQEYYADVDRRNNQAFSDLAREVELPKVKTVTERMGVDDRGNLWVQTQEGVEKEGVALTAYDIFNSEGHYICRTWIEFEPRLFVRGKMYRIHSDEETGFRSVKRYRVIWSD